MRRDLPEECIIVTGSSGLLGHGVIRALAPHYAMIGFDRDGEPYPPPEAECISCDISDCASIERALRRVDYAYGRRIASVIHLAAYYTFSEPSSPLYEKVTVNGTRDLLDALRPFEVEQFVFSSTMLVHAPTQPGHPITEDSPLEGKWDYPKSKIITEQIIRENRRNMKVVNLRIAGVYSDKGDSIPITNQIQRIYEKQFTSHFFSGDTTHGASFVHIEDVVDAIARCVDRRAELAEVLDLLIGEPETVSYGQLQEALGTLIHGVEWNTLRVPKPLAKVGAWVQDKAPLG